MTFYSVESVKFGKNLRCSNGRTAHLITIVTRDILHGCVSKMSGKYGIDSIEAHNIQ